MAKYHISPETGNPGLCKAQYSCPFGGEKDHYGSKAEARKAYEQKQEKLAQDTVQAEKIIGEYLHEHALTSGSAIATDEEKELAEVCIDGWSRVRAMLRNEDYEPDGSIWTSTGDFDEEAWAALHRSPWTHDEAFTLVETGTREEKLRFLMHRTTPFNYTSLQGDIYATDKDEEIQAYRAANTTAHDVFLANFNDDDLLTDEEVLAKVEAEAMPKPFAAYDEMLNILQDRVFPEGNSSEYAPSDTVREVGVLADQTDEALQKRKDKIYEKPFSDLTDAEKVEIALLTSEQERRTNDRRKS